MILSAPVPLYELDLQLSTATLAPFFVVIIIAKVHQLAHATAETMAKMVQRAVIVFSGDGVVSELVVFVWVLVLVLFLPDEIPTAWSAS